jgi:glyoxylase-like metal-dependent hydrolase (beta-lactamase superfamily II)
VARYPELADGDAVRTGGLEVFALHTPGHCSDHLCFWLPGDRVLFTGDLVLGQGSSMVTYPEGDVAAYLSSLERVAELKPRMLFPGHWDTVSDGVAKIEEYRRHRLEREAQLVDELARGPGTAEELTRRVYAAEVGDSEQLLRAAEMTLRAHLKKLVDEGRVRESGETFELAAPPT